MDYKLERNTQTNQWDQVVDGGDYVLIDGKEEILQRVLINLSTFYGEFFPAPTAGTKYFENVFPYEYTDQVLQGEFKRVINNTTGVSEIKDITFSMSDDNTLKMVAEIETDDGETATVIFNQ